MRKAEVPGWTHIKPYIPCTAQHLERVVGGLRVDMVRDDRGYWYVFCEQIGLSQEPLHTINGTRAARRARCVVKDHILKRWAECGRWWRDEV